jgi:hypothetical protein
MATQMLSVPEVLKSSLVGGQIQGFMMGNAEIALDFFGETFDSAEGRRFDFEEIHNDSPALLLRYPSTAARAKEGQGNKGIKRAVLSQLGKGG